MIPADRSATLKKKRTGRYGLYSYQKHKIQLRTDHDNPEQPYLNTHRTGGTWRNPASLSSQKLWIDRYNPTRGGDIANSLGC